MAVVPVAEQVVVPAAEQVVVPAAEQVVVPVAEQVVVPAAEQVVVPVAERVVPVAVLADAAPGCRSWWRRHRAAQVVRQVAAQAVALDQGLALAPLAGKRRGAARLQYPGFCLWAQPIRRA